MATADDKVCKHLIC